MIDWSDLVFEPDDEALRALVEAWSWRLTEPFTPLLFSIFGDMFFARDDGRVCWLNCGTGDIEEVAASEAEFRQRLAGEDAEWWLLPDLVDRLHAVGKIPPPGHCYTYAVLPIFEGDAYAVENFAAAPAREHWGWTGEAHEQLADLPDGACVSFEIGE